jgi:hypothetical protein
MHRNVDSFLVRVHSLIILHIRSDKIKFKDVGIKEIYQIEVPADTEVPDDWVKVSLNAGPALCIS